MSFIPDQELEKVRSSSDIVQVIGERIPLKKSGRHFKACCPFHNEKTPSFMVNPERQIYHCFGCGEGGDVFSFLMKFEGLEFVESVERLADRHGIVLTRSGNEAGRDGVHKAKAEKELLFRMNRLAARFFFDALFEHPSGQKGRAYLERRGIRTEIARESLLGYAPGDGNGLTKLLVEKNVPFDKALSLGLVRRGDAGDYYDFFRDRLINTILSSDGKILAFSGRALEDEAQPKYLNSPESPVYHKSGSLLGIQIARPALRERDEVILVEGNFDLLRLHQEGIRNVVAPLGTALTEGQVRCLARWTRNFVLIFDGDEAGAKAVARVLPIFLPLGIYPRVVILPKGEDPDSFVGRQGVQPLRDLVSRAPLLLDSQIELILSRSGQGPQGQVEAVREITGLLALLPGEVERRLYIQRVGKMFGLSEGLIQAEMIGKKGMVRSAQKKTGNFSAPNGDEPNGERVTLPALERTVLEVLLSERVISETLFREIDVKDFSHPQAGEVWRSLKEDFGRNGTIDVARVLMTLPEGPMRKLVTELTIGSSRWGDEGNQVAADCLRQLRMARMRGFLKNLSQAIRKAESAQDLGRMNELLEQKNKLFQELKEITSLH